jgi:hypothetical protein
MELIGHPEMLVTNHQSTQRDISDELTSHLHHARNLKLCMNKIRNNLWCVVMYVLYVHEGEKVSACRPGCIWMHITSPNYWSDLD